MAKTRRGKPKKKHVPPQDHDLDGNMPARPPKRWAKHVLERPLEVKLLERGTDRLLPAGAVNWQKFVRQSRHGLRWLLTLEEREKAAAEGRQPTVVRIESVTERDAYDYAMHRIVTAWAVYDSGEMMLDNDGNPEAWQERIPLGLLPKTEEEVAATEARHAEDLAAAQSYGSENHDDADDDGEYDDEYEEEEEVDGSIHEPTFVGSIGASFKGESNDDQQLQRGGGSTYNHNSNIDPALMDRGEASTRSGHSHTKSDDSSIVYYEAKLAESEQALDDLKKEYIAKKSDYDELRNKYDANQEYTTTIEYELEAHRDELNTVKSTNQKIENENAFLTKAVHDHEAQVEHMTREDASMQQLLAASQAKASEALSDVEILQNELNDCNQRFADLEADSEAYQQELRAVHLQIAALSSKPGAPVSEIIAEVKNKEAQYHAQVEALEREKQYNLHDETGASDDELPAQTESLGEALGNQSDAELDEDTQPTAEVAVLSMVDSTMIYEMVPESPAVSYSDLADEIKRLTDEKEQLKGLNKTFIAKLRTEQEVTHALSKELETMKLEQKDLWAAVREYDELKLKYVDQEAFVEDAKAQDQKSQLWIAGAKGRLMSLLDEKEALVSERDSLRVQLGEKASSAAQLEHDLRAKEAEIAEKAKTHSGSDQKLKAALGKAEKLVAENDELKASLDSVQQTVKDKISELKTTKNALDAATKRAANADKDISALNAKVKEQAAVIIEQTSDLKMTKTELKTIKIELDAATMRAASAEKEISTLNAKVKEQAATLNDKISELKTTSTQLDAATKRAATTDKELLALNAKVTEQAATISNQTFELKTLKTELKTNQIEVDAAIKRATATDKEISTLNAKVKEQAAVINDKEAENDRLKRDLKASKIETDKLLTKVNANTHLEEKVREQTATIKEKTAQNDDHKAKLKKSTAEAEQLRNEVQGLQKKLSQAHDGTTNDKVITINRPGAPETIPYWLLFLLVMMLSLVLGRFLVAPHITQHGLHAPAIQYSPAVGALESWIGVNTFLGG